MARNFLFICVKFGTCDLNPTSRSVPLISPNFTFLPLYECLRVFACNFALMTLVSVKKQINQNLLTSELDTCVPYVYDCNFPGSGYCLVAIHLILLSRF